MKLVILIGPIAVGKMSVGLELSKMTGMPLFHNHVSIEMLLPIFEWGSKQFNILNKEFRRRIFEEAANSDLPGLIFTYVWAFDVEADKVYIDDLIKIFHEVNAPVYFVELEAEINIRRERNRTQLRLQMKPSKRDIQVSDKRMMINENKYQLNSNDDFFYKENYIRIDNTNLSPAVVSKMIIDKFGF
ncbi:MAG: AAA family ATPase [Candidatus Heimdallarchaeota archaeon]|nr:AAA family ATPase [Candidatus Heimdallarchaeota archaeon]